MSVDRRQRRHGERGVRDIVETHDGNVLADLEAQPLQARHRTHSDHTIEADKRGRQFSEPGQLGHGINGTETPQGACVGSSSRSQPSRDAASTISCTKCNFRARQTFCAQGVYCREDILPGLPMCPAKLIALWRFKELSMRDSIVMINLDVRPLRACCQGPQTKVGARFDRIGPRLVRRSEGEPGSIRGF
ncbi:hypothetical protein [Rhizobium sp. CF080]|uniref:hypothetical protein n=1 Tax=Rhizobium sp. (strain CF080) TaxID=1144310 RepID=UPI000271B454|nr:hypothetical protein [Rhizobium sp. CF080]